MKPNPILFAAFLLGFALIGCSEAGKSAAGFQIELESGKTIGMTDDRILLEGRKRIGTLTADGKVRGPEGESVATINREGELRWVSGPVLANIDESGFITGETGSMKWENGRLKIGEKDFGCTLTPADTPSKREASVLFFLFHMPQQMEIVPASP